MAKALPAELRQQALTIYAQHGARETSRRLADQGHQVAESTLRDWARAAGVRSRRAENVRAAVEVSRLTLQQRRQQLALALLGDAERLREQLFAPALARHWTKDGEFREQQIDQPDFADQRQIVTAVAIAVDKVQLLTGEATARTESMGGDPAERAQRLREMRDELAERRARAG